MNGKEYIWEDQGKYYFSTAPYRQYGVEINYTEFCEKKLLGAVVVDELPWLSYTTNAYAYPMTSNNTVWSYGNVTYSVTT